MEEQKTMLPAQQSTESAQMMGTSRFPIGAHRPFNPQEGSWDTWILQFRSYLEINFISDSNLMRSCLLASLTPKAFEELRRSCLPTTPYDFTYDECVAKMKELYGRRVILMRERANFFRITQSDHQTPKQFANSLREAAGHCNFETFNTEAALVLQFINGMKNEEIKLRLLAKENIKLDEALSFLEMYEEIHGCNSRVTMQDCHAVQETRALKPKGVSGICHCCGEAGHFARKCKFQGSKCFKCGKQGHLAKVCKHPQKLGKSQKQRPQNSWKDHKLYADGIYAVKERAHNFEVTVKINGKSTRMEQDTGAAVTIVTPECWKSIGSLKLKRATVMLRSFTGHEVNLKGETLVTVEGDTGTRKLLLRVAKNGATNVMGQDWINAFRAGETLRSLLVNTKEVNAVESRTQKDVCVEFPEVFEDGLGHCTKVKAHVELKDGVVPVFRKPFPLAFAMHDAVEKELERYVDMGVLTPIDRSAWAAPIVTVKKPNGKIRICADFSTGLNDRLMVDSYPIPRPEDLYQALRGGKTFTKLDLSEAYLQVELDEESKKILVINTHKGLFHYNRLPFGVASAPAIFQKVMDTMLAGIPNVAAYLDDIILTGATDDEHRRTLKLVLGRLKEFGLRIRKEKCTFFQREVEYLGHILSSMGIRADPKKTAAIVNMPLPANIAKLRSFLGMCNYYTEFVPKLAELCSPLNQLLRKDTRWNWTGEHTKAVERVKRLLNSPLLLTHYHPEWPIVLAADASNEGIGAVVYHRLSDGTVKVIAHASKTLNAAQRNYGQIEKEALALVYGVKKFHKYLWGRRFTLLTDHKPLVSIFGSKKGVPQMAACRLTRWAIALMNYSFDIEYRSTKNFCQADCLSRLPSSSDELFDANFDHREAEDELSVKQLIVELQAELPVTARVIAEATEKDSVLKQVKQFVLSGWPEKCPREELRSYFIKRTELSVSYGCLLWGIRTVIPMKLRSRVLMKLHDTHPGRERMVSMARQFCWWPAMNKDIEMKVQSCEGCATAQKNQAKVAVKPWEVADRPWKRIHVDFAGPVNGKMFMIVVDAHSKWPEVLHMPHITTEQTIESLKTVFTRFGFPEVLVSDNGTQFTATEFTIFCAENGIRHVTSAPYHAQSNGQVERFIDTFKRALKKSTNDRRPQKDRLREFLMTYRITPHPSTKLTPSEMFLKRRIRTVFDLMFPRGIENLEEQKRKMENTSGNRADRQFKIGETVMVRDYTRDRKLWREGVIVGQRGQVTWFVQVGRMTWKRHTNQMRHKNTRIADGQEEKENEVGSLLDEALPAGNIPNPADENVQDIEAPNIFQDQTSTPHKGSVDSSKAAVDAESSSTTSETDDREHKPDGSVTMKQDEVPQKLRR
ncbi:Uncharacterized protein T11_7653 [Trichinella zimbabwensis]|uniref:RNA-directed DNA polymerase n=1 Tax=Trichinella zimbabwensis TaxID=268475 RepID=A0A0V1HJS5_9BILA|nr:Uncharacterized protein T11_7653 [Trichinella zimbabwensis]